MLVDKNRLAKSIEEAVKSGKKRNFTETVEMAVKSKKSGYEEAGKQN